MINTKYIKYAIFAMFSILAFHVSAQTISGRVVSVADGDTLTVLTDDYQQFKIRLAGIDAPEKSQAFGQVSKHQLSKLCFNKQAEVNVVTTDKYRRVVGDVFCENIHANKEMVRDGYAWVYRQYSKGFEQFIPLEQAAQEARIGLWADAQPTPPWQWRRSNKRGFR
jgi:endonuclease YncB( thermonuclease family)